MANPTLLTQPFAANGDKNVIPNTTAVQGAFSQDKGFPAECSLPLGAGGVAPSRQDFNGAFNMLSSLMYYTQKGYTWHWDAGQEYFVDCVVVDDTDGKMYRCINNVAAGGSVPSTDSTNWKLDTVDLSSRANTDLSNLSATGEAKLIPTNADFVVDSYSDAGGNWWRKYKSGWVEQGGIAKSGINVSYILPFAHKVAVSISPLTMYTNTANATMGNALSLSATEFIIHLNGADTSYRIASEAVGIDCAWYACGQGANI